MDSETKDVSAIQDEDVLRRLWQQTEDFGRKKEIRAHMYKLRETRLKEFYTSGEVLKDVQRSNSSPGLREQHSEKNNQKWVEGGVTHADSLADHSFLSLKSKEIRDSESPTREVQFKNSRNRCENDGTWTVASKTTKSEDGKMITNTQVAATHGSRPIDDGNKSYAAINQQQTSVYTDGDANNFTKAIGESSKSFAQEQTVSGDENNFRTSKTVSSSSSSKFVSHSSSTTGDINIDGPFSKQLQIEDGKSGTTKIIHHGDVNIDDYSVGKHQTESTTKKSVSSKTQREVQEGSSSKSATSRIESSYAPQIDQNKSTTVITRTIQSSEIPEDLQKSINDGNTKVTTETKTLPDGSTVTTTRYETKGSKKWSATSGSTQVTSSSNRQVLEQKSSSLNIDQKHITDGKQNKTVITTATKVIDNYPEAENIKLIKTDRHDGQDIHITKKQNVEHVKNVESKVTHKDVKVQENNVANQTVKVIKTITTEDDQLQPVVKQVPQIEKQTHVTTSKTTTIKTDVEQADNKKIQDVGTKRDVPQKKEPKQPVKETTPVEPTKSCKPPAETYKPSEPTEGQYSTTYRAEFTPKRISVELGPQHDAFARSLRCKSPDHTSERPNSRQSTSSLRSSTSPEKLSPSRKSPERKPSYDRRSPDKYPSEVERKHNTSPSRPVEYSPERNRKSPERNYSSTITSETKTYNTDTITRRKSSSTRKSPERPITTSPVRSYSPTKSSPTKSGPSSPVKSSPTSPTKSTDVIITTKITRTSTSPEKTSPRGKSPTKQDRSPTKPKAPSDIPTYNSDTITRKKKPTQDIPEDGNKISKPIDLTIQTTEKVVTKTGTLTKRKPEKPTSRDASPTTSVSDFEFVISNNSHIVTDLDEPETNKLPENQRPTSLDINISTTTVTNTKKTKSSSPVKEIPRKLSKQSPTKSPVKETTSPVKDYKPSAPEEDTPSYIVDEIITSTNVTSVCTKPDEPKEKPPLKRTETYEERCRKILGLPEPDKPIIKDEIIPQEYAGKTPVEEPLFVKKHIDYGHPEDDLIHKTTEKIRNRKAERKEPVDITEFISVERNIENEIMPVEDTLPEPKKPKSSSPGRKSPEKQKPQSKNKHPGGYSTEDINEFIEQTADRTEVNRSPQKESPGRKSPEKQKPQSKNKHPGEYSTEDINEFIEQTADRTEVSRSPQKETDDIPNYMRPIPKISPEERDKMILEIRQREISPDKEPKRKPTEGEYTTEYTDEFIEKTTDKRTRKSPTPKHFTTEGQYTTEYTDEYGEITTGTKRSPIKPKTTPDIIKPDITKISETYKQIEVPVRAKSPPKKPEKKKSKTPIKPKDKKPVDDESSTTDDESENVEEYYETEIKSKDKRISRKSPSPVRRVPDSDRDSPGRGLSEDKTVTEYINEYCKDTKEQDETIIRTKTDFISNEKYDTDITLKRNDAPKRKSPEKQLPDIEFNLEKENEQREHIRTHRIDTVITTDETKVSPREESPKRTPHKTECTIKKTTTVTENGYSTPKKDVKPTKKPQKPLSPEDRSKSPTKPIKDTKKEIIRTTATKVITKKSSADVIDTTLKKRSTTHEIPKDKSPERRRSPSPTHKTLTKKVIETEQITRKCSKKEIPINNIPERKPIKQIPKSSQPIKTTETPKKHVVTKNISLTSPKSQPTSPVKETRSFSPTKTSPKSITTVKTTKVTHPATITVTKTTKTTTKNIKQKPKDVEQTDTDSELDIENLKTVINNKTSTNRKVVTTAKINVTSPKQPAVQMPAIQRSTSSREPSPDKICPIPVSSDDEFGHPRYPDQVSEPDDTPSRKKPQKITNIPLTEGEDVKDFNRITEVTETETITTKRTSPRITDIDRVTETDESLLSVTEKVSKFINSAEKLTDDDKQPRKPSPKIPRSEIIITDDLKEDECLLSVTDKVTKFINTADNIATKKPSRTQSPVITTTTTTNNFKVEENDDCLKSVNEKVSHFIHAAENIKPKRTSPKEGPAPKVTRPEFTDLDETLKTDECLLSVSDKVSKFLTTAEKLTTETSKTKSEIFINKEKEVESERKPKTPLFHSPSRKSPEKEMPQRKSSERKYPERESPERKSPERKYPERESPERKYPERYSPDRKYSERESPERKSPERNYPKRESPEKELFVRKSPEKTPCSKTNRPKSEPIQPLDTKPLKSSEAVKKAKAMFENISKTQEVPKQRDILSRPSVWEGRKKPEQTPATDLDVKLTDIGVYKKPETKTTEIRKKLNYNEKTDLKDVTLKSTKLILNENKLNKPCDVGIHIRTSSPERDDIPGYMRPIPKVTTEERDQLIIEARLRESVTPERETYRKVVTEHEERTTEVLRSKPIENGDLPGYMRPLQRCLSPEREHKKSVHEEEEIVVETTPPKRSYSPPERDVPGYMKPLQRNVSPDRDGYKPRDSEDSTSPALDDTPRAGKKFGVILRRTDSGRMVPTERKRSSIPGEPVIEDIQDLEILEKMMDKVVGYEQRRRIRAQIRIVKKLISENKINISKRVSKTTYSTREQISSTDRRSPSKKLVPTKERSKSPETKKLQSKTTRERSLSPDLRKPTCYSPPERDNRTKIMRDRSASPEFKTRTNITENTYKYSTRSEKIESRSSRERSISPEIKKSTSTTSKAYKTDLKHVQPVNKTKTVQDDKPSWITNRNLKKTMAETVTEKKIIVPPKTKQTPAKRAPSPQKELKPTDCITSSYGIGPTDENGLPLFGIKALRKATTDNVQVRGTVVTSQFYSENGGEPVGEVTVTKYSTDPKELNIKDTKNKGFTSVTTTQKFGTRGVPTLSALTDKKKAITDKKSEEDELIKTTSTKVTRRGSVKALSQKFVENAAEIAAKEKQITYPKAGLILRTSSFKDSTQSFTERTRTTKSSSRESSPGYQSRPTKISLESITSDSRNFASTTTTEHCEDTKTFLNSNTRVANAQDVITRMKNAEKEHHEGDSVEDREARMLLNKFLGAQVLMTGMEPLLGTGSSAQSAVSSSAQLVRKVQKSKTTTSSSTSSSKIKDTGKQLSIKQRFQCPITPEVLQDIWDEQTLRALLEQCTDYEERRAIRARLRQVMAEQEAVANVISSAVSERESSDNRQSVHERFETSKNTFSEGPITTTKEVTTRVISKQQVSKPMSPFAKFRQLDKQNSLNTPPSSPRTPTGSGAPLFKFTDPALSHSASTVKDRLLHWCQMKTREYENVKLENFSTSWADGLAFCALIHHFLPNAFDYHALTPQQRRHNFTLAFKVADEQAGIFPLLDVDDMVAMRRPDWKCVFTYVQAIYRRFKDED